MFAALRAPARKAVLSTSFRKSIPARTSFRRYSTEDLPPAAKSNLALYAGLGIAVSAGFAAYWYTSTDAGKESGTALKSGIQAVKAKTNFTPTKEDYQKVSSH